MEKGHLPTKVQILQKMERIDHPRKPAANLVG
jgi:hypothetical protein